MFSCGFGDLVYFDYDVLDRVCVCVSVCAFCGSAILLVFCVFSCAAVIFPRAFVLTDKVYTVCIISER